MHKHAKREAKDGKRRKRRKTPSSPSSYSSPSMESSPISLPFGDKEEDSSPKWDKGWKKTKAF